ncbi:SGNH/GDSL hydrolase family protein [Enterobacter vonholyi]
MPMNNQTVSVAPAGTAIFRPLSEWMSQLRQMQKAPVMTGPVQVMSCPPVATLTKGTGASGVTITSAGSGYVSGETLTVRGGAFAAPARLRITGVDGSGAITSVAVSTPGVYTATPANPVSVTGGSGTGATFTLTWNVGVASSIGGVTWSRTSPVFKYIGYAPKDVVAGYRGNTTWGVDTQAIIEFVSDAPVLDFRFVGYNSQYDLFVDGQRIANRSVKTDSSGQPHIYTVDWSGVVKPRTYRLSGLNMAFGGVVTGGNYGVWYPTGSNRPFIWQLGDSYTFGNGATQANFAEFRVMCDMLGLDGIADGIGGAGWTSSGSTQPQQRIQNKLTSITYTPEIITLALGYNDAAGGNISRLQTNWRESVTLIRQLCPLAKVIQIGPATPIGSTGQISAVRTALMDLCAEAGIPFIDVNDWINANNKQLYTDGDLVHPNDAGHWFRGSRLAAAISELTGFGIATPYRDTPDGFLLDVFNWTGSVDIPNTPGGFLNLLGLPGIAKASGGTAGLTLDGDLLKFPARIKPSGVTFTVRISGIVGGASGVVREWKIQTRRPDGVTIVGSASTVKVPGTDITNRDVILRSFTSGVSDAFTTQGVMVGLQNDTTQILKITSVSIRVDRNVNAE